MRNIALISATLFLLATVATAQYAPIRHLSYDGKGILAVGDRGTILTSDNMGTSWKPLKSPAKGNFQSVTYEGKYTVYIFGGLALPGHPGGAGKAVLLRSDDAGKTFKTVPCSCAQWLYGGRFNGETGVLFGQASPGCPSGLMRTVTAGQDWSPMATESHGPISAGVFQTTKLGSIVGAKYRMLSLKHLKSADVQSPPTESDLNLSALCLADDNRYWAVGENGTVLRSRTADESWEQIPVRLPIGTRLLADYEAIAFASPRAFWIGGGQLGCILHTADGGVTWQKLTAPSPGAIHALLAIDDKTVLAAGDSGRIWRSSDAGKTWKLTRGSDKTDVLFILAAGDLSCYPAIVAHCQAGLDVAVLFVTRPNFDKYILPDQPLRAAALQAGASAVAVLTDFPSQVLPSCDAKLSESEIIKTWSAALDSPAEPILIRQIAAAIRQYRPAVVVTGPSGLGPTGTEAENRLIARLAGKAVELAGKKNIAVLNSAGLQPSSVQRIFTALESNARWNPPWKKTTRPRKNATTTIIDAAGFPRGSHTNIEMLCQAAIWRLPWLTSLDNRPGRFSAYKCKSAEKRLAMFTTGLIGKRLKLTGADKGIRDISTAASFKYASETETVATLVGKLVEVTRKFPDDPLGPDRLLLVRNRLLADGKLLEADEATRHFITLGSRHPLHRQIATQALASYISTEWNAQRRRQGLSRRNLAEILPGTAKRFAGQPAWNATPQGRLLLARALTALDKKKVAKDILVSLADDAYPDEWKVLAERELTGNLPNKKDKTLTRMTTPIELGSGKIDGRLDEAFWKTAPKVTLTRSYGYSFTTPPTGSFRAVRTRTHIIFAVSLPSENTWNWKLRIAIDADRDAWTQVVITCDTDGDRKAELLMRGGPAATLNKRILLAGGWDDKKLYTFEFALPLASLNTDTAGAATWLFQVAAEGDRFGKKATLHYQKQNDERMLPERYGLLDIPKLKTPETKLEK